MLRASTSGCVGHLNMRVWASVNQDGSSARELTSGSLVGTAVTLSTTADVNGMGTTTWSPAAITLNNEYLFFQLEWQETTTGGSNGDNVFFRVGTALITTTNFTAVWAGNATFAAVAAETLLNNTINAALQGGRTLTPAAAQTVNAQLRLATAASFALGGVSLARGFGTTLGAGTTDNIVTGLTTAPTQRSWFVWINPHGVGGGTFGRIFNVKDGAASDVTQGLSCFFNASTAQLVFSYGASTARGLWGWTAPALDTWSSLGISFDNSSITNNPIVFQNGTKLTVGSGLTIVETAGGTFNGAAGFPLEIGNRQSDSARNWDGLLAGPSVWDRILSDAEFASLSAGSFPSTIPGLAGCWPILGQSPEPDVSGNGNNGTVVGTTVVAGPPNFQGGVELVADGSIFYFDLSEAFSAASSLSTDATIPATGPGPVSALLRGGNQPLYSTTIDSWAAHDASVAANADTAPDGSNTAYTLTEDGATADHYVLGPSFRIAG